MSEWLPPGPLRMAVLFPHPDDELALLSGLQRWSAGHEIHALWIHSTPVREAESRRVMAMLPLAPERLQFWQAPDGQVLEAMPDLVAPLRRWLDQIEPDVLLLPAFEQGHLDHDTVHLLGRLTFAGTPYEYPLYHPYATRFPAVGAFSDPAREVSWKLSAEEQRLKQRALTCYRSQNIRRNLIAAEARAQVLGHSSLLSSERTRPVEVASYLRPAHGGKLARRIERSAPWKRWTSFVQSYLSARHLGEDLRVRS